MADERETIDEPMQANTAEPATGQKSRRSDNRRDRGTLSDSRVGRSVRKGVRGLDSQISEGSVAWLVKLVGQWLGYFFTSVNEWSKIRRLSAQRRAEDSRAADELDAEAFERMEDGN